MEKTSRAHRRDTDRNTAFVIVLLLIAGGLLGWHEIRQNVREERGDLLRTARLLADTVNLRRLKALAGGSSDLDDPHYRRLKEQCMSVLSALPPGFSVSLLGRRPDGSLFHLLDARSSGGFPPGEPFAPPSPDFHLPFDEGRTLVLGPFTDAETDTSSLFALVPLSEPKSRQVTAVLRLESNKDGERMRNVKAGGVWWSLTLLLVLLALLGKRIFASPWDGIPRTGVMRYAEPLWVAALCLVLTAAAVWQDDKHEFRAHSRAFAVLSDLESASLTESLRTLRDGGLEGLGRFFESSEFVDSREFADYTEHLVAAPEIDVALWMPGVPPEKRGDLKALSGSREMCGPARCSQVNGGKSAAFSSSWSFPVLYANPSVHPLCSFGFDMMSVPSFAKGLETARTSLMTTASEPVIGCGAPDGDRRIAVFRPVREGGRGRLQGVAAIILNLGELLRSTMLRDQGAENHVMKVELWRLFPDGERKLLVAEPEHLSNPMERTSSEPVFRSLRPFFIFGLPFALEIRSGEGFAAMHPRRAGGIALFAGIAVTVLLSIFTAFFVNRRETLRRLVAIKTAALSESEFRFRKLAHLYRSISEGVMVMNSDGVIEDCNPALEELTGYTLQEMLGKRPEIFSAREGQFDENVFLPSIGENGGWQGELWYRRKDGEVYPVWITITAVTDGSRKVTHYSGVVRYMGGIKSEQERLNRMAYHDFLTGLPNRALLADRFEMALARAKREKDRIALVFLDLDKFKEINDAFGHEAGDMLLISVAKRLGESFRERDTVARFAGDEFVLLFDGMEEEGELSVLLERLKNLFRTPFQVGERELSIEASFGVALFPDDGADARILMDAADRAMYAEKERRRGER